MASISHTVGGTENLVSFKSAARVPITSLKAYFKPIQEGEGDPSPENVRSISGWNGIEGYKCGKNLFDMNSLSNQKNIREENNFYYNTVADTRDYTNIYLEFWDVLSTTFVTRLQNVVKLLSSNGKTSFVFTIKEECKDAKVIRIKYNGQKNDFIIGTWPFNLQIGHTYTCSMDVTGFDTTVIGGFSVGNIQIEEGLIATEYEPYRGETIPVTFPVLGKNKFNTEMEWTVGKTYRYAYLPELENLCNISFTLKDSTVDLSDVSVGFSYYAPSTVSEANKGYIWCLGNGVIKTYAKINIANNGENTGKICTYLTIYPNTQDVYNRLTSAYDIQIEYGDTATTYEPYNPDNTVYGGYVDLVKGELVQEWKIIDLGTLNWSYAAAYSSSYPNWPHFYNSDLKDKKKGWNNGIISIYPLVSSTYDRTKDIAFTCTAYHSSYNICIRDTRYTTLEDFKTAIKGIQYCYELNESIHYPLSSQELTTLLNQNNIWTSTNDVTEVSYAIHDTAPIRAARKRIQAAAPDLETQEGELINFETDLVAPLKECKAYFSPVQEGEGDPNPENIRPIEGWENFEVTRTGLNIFDMNTFAKSSENYSVQVTNGVAVGTATSFHQLFSKDGKYLILNNFLENRVYIQVTAYNEGNNNSEHKKGLMIWVSYTNGTSDNYYFYNDDLTATTLKFSTSASKTINKIGVSFDNNGANIWHITEFQITPVSNITTYHPYDGTTIPITFPTEAGTIYGGYVDLVGGEVVATSQIITVDGSQVLYGPYTFYNGSTCTNRYIIITNLQGGYPLSYNTDASSHFSRAFNAIWSHPDDDSWKYTYNGQQLHMVFENSIVGITEEMSSGERTEKIKNWLIENQPQFIYPLSTPIYYSITPKILKTLRGTNNIWSSANDNIEIKYWKH